MSHTHDPSERWGQKREPLCGPDCTYRRLYEGTRLSLSDMASQHASAISAHQHVRNGVIKLLKRVFYSEFQEAERQSGVPMTKVTDEALLLFLESFLTLARDRQQMPHGVEALRASLLARGVEVPNSSDFEAWAEAVRVMPMPQDTDDRLPVIQVDPATLVEVEARPTRSTRVLSGPASRTMKGLISVTCSTMTCHPWMSCSLSLLKTLGSSKRPQLL